MWKAFSQRFATHLDSRYEIASTLHLFQESPNNSIKRLWWWTLQARRRGGVLTINQCKPLPVLRSICRLNIPQIPTCTHSMLPVNHPTFPSTNPCKCSHSAPSSPVIVGGWSLSTVLTAAIGIHTYSRCDLPCCSVYCEKVTKSQWKVMG